MVVRLADGDREHNSIGIFKNRKEQAMENTFKVTQARYSGFKFLVDFQFKALGFRTCGKQAIDVTDGYESTAEYYDSTHIQIKTERKHHIEKTAFYRRHSAYPTNILLELPDFAFSSCGRFGRCSGWRSHLHYFLLCWVRMVLTRRWLWFVPYMLRHGLLQSSLRSSRWSFAEPLEWMNVLMRSVS